jgi:hypothetical protein
MFYVCMLHTAVFLNVPQADVAGLKNDGTIPGRGKRILLIPSNHTDCHPKRQGSEGDHSPPPEC